MNIAPWVPFFQTLMWVALLSALALIFKTELNAVLALMLERIRLGAPIKAGPVEIGPAPPSVAGTLGIAAATLEGRAGVESNETLRERLWKKNYPEAICEKVYLVHASEVLRERTVPGSGRYRVRIWVEAYDSAFLEQIVRVTYRLYDDFQPNVVLATQAREKNFELWLNVYGEFTVVAYAEKEAGDGLWLTRYLDLPGRPPD